MKLKELNRPLYFGFLLMIAAVWGCGGKTQENQKESNQVPVRFDEDVFQIIKNNDADALPRITLSAEQEEKLRASSEMKLDKGLSERSIRGAQKGLQIIHEETAMMGFDWSQAKLVDTRFRGNRKENSQMRKFDPDATDIAEIYLVIESGNKTIGVHLDDCAKLESGVIVVGDGLRFIKDVGPIPQ